jgi:hypothetical protein
MSWALVILHRIVFRLPPRYSGKHVFVPKSLQESISLLNAFRRRVLCCVFSSRVCFWPQS